jgi:hypothetical protein
LARVVAGFAKSVPLLAFWTLDVTAAAAAVEAAAAADTAPVTFAFELIAAVTCAAVTPPRLVNVVEGDAKSVPLLAFCTLVANALLAALCAVMAALPAEVAEDCAAAAAVFAAEAVVCAAAAAEAAPVTLAFELIAAVTCAAVTPPRLASVVAGFAKSVPLFAFCTLVARALAAAVLAAVAAVCAAVAVEDAEAAELLAAVAVLWAAEALALAVDAVLWAAVAAVWAADAAVDAAVAAVVAAEELASTYSLVAAWRASVGSAGSRRAPPRDAAPVSVRFPERSTLRSCAEPVAFDITNGVFVRTDQLAGWLPPMIPSIRVRSPAMMGPQFVSSEYGI